jgi:hypothetical protein
VEGKISFTDLKVPRQCPLLVNVDWRQSGTLRIEHGKMIGNGLFEFAAEERS